MSDSKITQSQYWREVSSLAKNIAKEAKDEDRDISDVLHETIDGHQWVIYTWAYPWVLMHSRSEDALFEEQGSIETSSYSDIMQKMTYYALYQDVSNEIAE